MNIVDDIRSEIIRVCGKLFGLDILPELTRPLEIFGDFSTNIALQISKKLEKNPRDVAEDICKNLVSPSIQRVEVAGPGFINIFLTDQALIKTLDGPAAIEVTQWLGPPAGRRWQVGVQANTAIRFYQRLRRLIASKVDR